MQYQNMGPFPAVSFKGNAQVHGVPTFVDKLPLTIGGIAGEDIHFGTVVSIDPTTNRRVFEKGIPSGNVIKGIAMLDPTIMRADPAMNDYYFAGKPMTAITFGLIDILKYDITQMPPVEGCSVWVNDTTGEIAFRAYNADSLTGYTKLKAFVYETYDPNGAKVFFGMEGLAAAGGNESVTAVATPTATPSAGEVAANTKVTLATTTAGAVIHYTLDDTTPTLDSPVYTEQIKLTAATTIKAIAVKEGLTGSAMLTAAYTISA